MDRRWERCKGLVLSAPVIDGRCNSPQILGPLLISLNVTLHGRRSGESEAKTEADDHDDSRNDPEAQTTPLRQQHVGVLIPAERTEIVNKDGSTNQQDG